MAGIAEAVGKSFREDVGMKSWTRPVIVEIQVGMEINLYVCAEL